MKTEIKQIAQTTQIKSKRETLENSGKKRFSTKKAMEIAKNLIEEKVKETNGVLKSSFDQNVPEYNTFIKFEEQVFNTLYAEYKIASVDFFVGDKIRQLIKQTFVINHYVVDGGGNQILFIIEENGIQRMATNGMPEEKVEEKVEKKSNGLTQIGNFIGMKVFTNQVEEEIEDDFFIDL